MAVTKDNVALHIDGVLYIEIVDPEKASYNVEQIYQAIMNLAQTTMRSEIGKLTLDKKAAILKAEGAAESMIIQAEAASTSIHMIDEALKKQGGIEAAQFLLGQRYISAYQ